MSHAQNWLQVVYAVRQRRPVTILGVTYVPQDTRPLVVIDPEDREAVERLARAYVATWTVEDEPRDQTVAIAARQMQAALREFADPKPPRPDEPQGLGAVVEAIHDNHFVHVGEGEWRRVGSAPGGFTRCRYEEIEVVRVLHDGWRA